MDVQYIDVRVKYPLFLSNFNEIWFFSTHFRQILKTSDLMKFVQWDPRCSMRTDRQTWLSYTLITNLMHWLLFIH